MGRLTKAEMAPLEGHLLICEECRSRLVLMDFSIAAILEALRKLREEMPDCAARAERPLRRSMPR
jgi:hypothetical protein